MPPHHQTISDFGDDEQQLGNNLFLECIYFVPIKKIIYLFSSYIALGMTSKDQHSAASRNNSRICLVILPRQNSVENHYQMEKRLSCISRWEYSWEKRAFLHKLLLQRIRQTFPALWIVQVLRATVPAFRKGVYTYVNSLTWMHKKAKKLSELLNPNFFVSMGFSIWRERTSYSLPCCCLLLILPP